MRIAQHAERLVLVVDGGILDGEAASGGQFGPDAFRSRRLRLVSE
jgi:hypothetical protein